MIAVTALHPPVTILAPGVDLIQCRAVFKILRVHLRCSLQVADCVVQKTSRKQYIPLEKIPFSVSGGARDAIEKLFRVEDASGVDQPPNVRKLTAPGTLLPLSLLLPLALCGILPVKASCAGILRISVTLS